MTKSMSERMIEERLPTPTVVDHFKRFAELENVERLHKLFSSKSSLNMLTCLRNELEQPGRLKTVETFSL